MTITWKTSLTILCALIYGAGNLKAAQRDRITKQVDTGQSVVIRGNVSRLAAPQFDKGAADPQLRMNYMLLMTKPTAAQQSDLDQLLADQQNPSSAQFHKWLTPEEFANRFGLSPGDHAKIAAWLKAEGFTVNEMARGRNWVAFSGTANQVERSLHTSIHRFTVNGKSHFANVTEPSVPEALAEVTAGFAGLNDFKLQSYVRPAPDFNSGKSHYLVPEDFETIYNLAPLYKLGLDGTGVGIAVVGESDVRLPDLQAFKKTYNLPANDPKMVNYSGVDPGYNEAEIEGDLDLEWSGALAPKATIYYVYGASAITAMIVAVNANYAPIVSISYGSCEINAAQSYYRSIAQQGNAQGITLLAASGDSGAAGCDPQGGYPFAEGGKMVSFPAVMPEVTAVGGTEFVEGAGTYWSSTMSPNLGSALSYIPETAWNETSMTQGLGASGGGASLFYSRPVWQTGPGVPTDSVRHVPDVSFSAAVHDGYVIQSDGSTGAVGGTSASTPSMAGLVALLNQFQVVMSYQAKPGLGNINPQLYRLAQSSPAVFHDTLTGNNIVPCGQGSQDCVTGSFGYSASYGYDMATGLGSIEAFDFFGQWNTVTQAATLTVSTSAAKATSNDTIQLTASVAPTSGRGTPTGTVSFSVGTLPLGSAALANGTAQVSFPAYLIGTGTNFFYAEYSGDAAFSSAGARTTIQISAPTGVASIVPSWPNTVWANLPDAFGFSWETTLSLREVAGVAAMLTGFSIDGQAQPVAQYFPTANILPRGSISSTFVLRNQATPLTHIYGFTGVDALGNNWSRQVSVNYNSLAAGNLDIPIAVTPQVVVQDVTAAPSCQWPAQVHLSSVSAYADVITSLYSGSTDITSQIVSIFGTPRLDPFGSLSGTICFGGIAPPATQPIYFYSNLGVYNEVNVNFAPPPAAPAHISASPASINLPAQAALSVTISDKTQPWTASIFPANRTTAWLSASQLSGTGSGQIQLTANGAGFEPGVYRATVVLQCINAVPQSVTVPVMFVLGGSTTGTAITGVGNAATFQNTAAPGMILTVVGTNLANGTGAPPSVSPMPFSFAGVSATVNGIAAPVVFVSPTQLNIQIPYEAATGPAVVGVNNNGQIAGYQFNITPSAPGIFATPQPKLTAGGTATIYLTGAGEVATLIATGSWPASATSLPKPSLPLSVTVGGVPAFLQSYGLTSGYLGMTQVSFTVPASLTPGTYPVVVTVGGVSSPSVSLTVQGS
jgi:uncharacterized protein (TIGR03437 family)